MALTAPSAVIGLILGVFLFIFVEMIINNLVTDAQAKRTLIMVTLLICVLLVLAVSFNIIHL